MKQTKIHIILTVFLTVLATILIFQDHSSRRGSGAVKESPAKTNHECSELLTREVLEESLDLGTRFMLNNQHSAGNFTYEYDWKKRRFSPHDSQVRQAGAAWGLTLINQYRPTPELGKAIQTALAFFRKHSETTADGRRYVVYPGESRGAMGTVALVALAHIDFLRTMKDKWPQNEIERLNKDLDGYLAFLLKAQLPNGLWHSRYSMETGEPFGGASPYFDGESLLALVKAAKYLGREHLWATIIPAADAGCGQNIVMALRSDPDSKTTKGYYQWASMAFFEIAASGRPATEKYGTYVIKLADWMIDVHKTLKRTRNTAYAYEGIIHAYELAERRNKKAKAGKFLCVIEKGLEKLTSWQVGGSMANSHIQKHPTQDPKAIGGVQNHRKEAPLRIDVAQHQMHAVVLALKYVYVE